MSLGKFLDPKNDFAFKQIFGTEKNQDILIHFLNDMIPFHEGAKVVSVTFLKPSLDPDTAAKKQSVVDVLCVDDQGKQYIVEMQVASTRGFEKRAQYYAAKAYASQMNSGEMYHDLKEIIFLAITNFVMFPDKKSYKSDHVILDKSTLDHDLKDFYFSFIELPKFKKTISELSNLSEKWVYFFKHAPETSPEDLKALIGSDTILAKAYNALDQFYWSSHEIRAYEQDLKSELDLRAIYEQKILEGEAKGEARGEAKGKAKATLQSARRLLSQGMSLETIQVVTGLMPATIATLTPLSEG